MTCHMDPTKPAVQQILAMHRDIMGRWIQTHTMADVEALDAEIRRRQAQRARLFGPPRPVNRQDDRST